MRAIAIAMGFALLLVAPISAEAADPAWHGNSPSAAPTLGIEATPSGNGYLLLDAAGGVFAHGDAGYFGSLPELRRTNPAIGQAPVVDLSLTRLGRGYWVLDEAGGIFTFGDAVFRGSVPRLREQGVDIGPGRIIDLAPVGDRGYYLLDEHGGVFTFGDLQFHGSIPQLRNQGVDIGDAKPVALVPAGTDGYWMLDEGGGVFAFGSAQFYGSAAGKVGPTGAVALAPYRDGKGYYILEGFGHVHVYGSARSFGSQFADRPGAAAVDMAAHPDGTGYWIAFNDGRVFTFVEQRLPGPQPPPSNPAPPPAPPPPPPPSPESVGEVADCRGDARGWGLGGGAMLSVWISTECASNATSDPEWVYGYTGPIVEVDLDGDSSADFLVAIYSDGAMRYAVIRLSDNTITCEGFGWGYERDFGANFSKSCLGSPSSWRLRYYMLWDSDPFGPTPVQVDAVPDDESFFGPFEIS